MLLVIIYTPLTAQDCIKFKFLVFIYIYIYIYICLLHKFSRYSKWTFFMKSFYITSLSSEGFCYITK